MPKWGTPKIVVNGKECEAVEKHSTDDLHLDQSQDEEEFFAQCRNLEMTGELNIKVELVSRPFGHDKRLRKFFFRILPGSDLVFLGIYRLFEKEYASRSAMRILRKRRRKHIITYRNHDRVQTNI